MDELKTQPAVVAEITVMLPNGDRFIAANLTVQFVSTMNGAKIRAEEIDIAAKSGNCNDEHSLLIRRCVSAYQETTAIGCKVIFSVSAFPVRIHSKPKPKSGWGSNG